MKTLKQICWMLITRGVAGLLLLTLLSWGQCVSGMVIAQPAPGAQLTLLESSDQAIVIELTVDNYQIVEQTQDGHVFQQILIPAMEQSIRPGEPQLPNRGLWLGVPTLDGLTLQIMATDFITLSSQKVAIMPQISVDSDTVDNFANDATWEIGISTTVNTLTDAFYPPLPVTLGETGYLREQAVAHLQVYAAQYNPVRGEVRLYRRIVVRLSWSSSVQAAADHGRWRNPVYESLLRHMLFNYDDDSHATTPFKPSLSIGNAPLQAALPNSQLALKIGIVADGLYRLTYTDLYNAGFDPSMFDPRTLKLLHRGIEQAIRVNGEEDGRFDPGDSIIFYGLAIHDTYTNENLYWLTSGEMGRRMGQRTSAPTGSAAIAFSFPVTHHAEQDTAYWQTMPGAGEERWFWDKRLSPNTEGMPALRTYPVVLQTIAPAQPATLRVRLKGYTNLAHRTRIRINDHLVDEQVWYGQVQFTHDVDIPASFLRSGKNQVTIEAVNTGAIVDQLLVNWIEVDYRATYSSTNDQLLFGSPDANIYQFTIGQFTGNEIWVLDITDPENPVQLIDFAITRNDRTYTVTVQDVAQPHSRYLALTTAQFQRTAFLTLDQRTAWKSPTNGADYIIITHADFYASADALARHRRAQGMRVAVVLVDDIYDEFNDGIFNPRAIRDFLSYAYQNWQSPAPLYLVLLGDANQDYKDNLQTDTHTYVPSQTMISELFGEVSSDQWFATISGNDSLPDLLLGRLSAQTPAEAADIVAKLIQYDQTPPDAAWNTHVVFVADDDELQFSQLSTKLAARLPFYYTSHHINVASYPPGDPAVELVNRMNSGAILVNYAGHGEYFGWGEWDQNQRTLFVNEDVAQLNNANHLPVITVANCLNGFFAGPKDRPSLAEVLQRYPNGGAIAIWAPTSLGYPSGHSLLMDAFYKAIFVEDQVALGAATTIASINLMGQSDFWQELVATYILFGDPATRLGIPPNYPYVKQTTPAQGAVDVALDQSVQVVFNKPMDRNTVNVSSDAVDLSFVSTWDADSTILHLSTTGFTPGRHYIFELHGQDRQGNSIGPGVALNPWSFTVTPDNLGPEATVRVPGDDPSAVLTTAALDVVFSEPVRRNSITYALAPFAAGSIYGQQDVVQTVQIVYNHLQVGQIYTFSLLTAKDRAGNLLQTPVQLSFQVTKTFNVYLSIIGKVDKSE